MVIVNVKLHKEDKKAFKDYADAPMARDTGDVSELELPRRKRYVQNGRD